MLFYFKLINWTILSITTLCIVANITYIILHNSVEIVVPTVQVSLDPLALSIYFEPIGRDRGPYQAVLNFALMCTLAGDFGQLSHTTDLLHHLHLKPLLEAIRDFALPGLNPLIDEYNLLLYTRTDNVDWLALEKAKLRILSFIIQRKINQNDIFLLERLKEDPALTEFFLRCVIAHLLTHKELFS